MTWTLVAQICTLMIVGSFLIDAVGSDLIDKWRKK